MRIDPRLSHGPSSYIMSASPRRVPRPVSPSGLGTRLGDAPVSPDVRLRSGRRNALRHVRRLRRPSPPLRDYVYSLECRLHLRGSGSGTAPSSWPLEPPAPWPTRELSPRTSPKVSPRLGMRLWMQRIHWWKVWSPQWTGCQLVSGSALSSARRVAYKTGRTTTRIR